MKSAILTAAGVLLVAALGGCTRQTIERHYSEETIQTSNPDTSRDGQRRPGSATVEERRSEPKIVVE